MAMTIVVRLRLGPERLKNLDAGPTKPPAFAIRGRLDCIRDE
jgi:hypothetical protein